MTGGGPHRQAEDAFVAGAEALVFGVLIFVVGTLIVISAWSVVDAKFATAAAAREAVRAAVEAPPGAALTERAEDRAALTLEGYGRDPAGMGISALGATELERCAQVGFEVTVTVPAIALVGDRALGEFRVSSRHFELVEPYRSGLPVEPDAPVGSTCVF